MEKITLFERIHFFQAHLGTHLVLRSYKQSLSNQLQTILTVASSHILPTYILDTGVLQLRVSLQVLG